MSEALPAGYGLITRIALVGYCCAFADAVTAIRIAATVARHSLLNDNNGSSQDDDLLLVIAAY